VLITGLFGGFEIGVGIMAYLGVLYETGSHLLAGLAFSAVRIALLLAKSELFTEGFLVPIAAVVALFGAIHTGAEISYLEWLGWFSYVVVSNMLGGILLVTALRLVSASKLVK
jgi:formate/nitrite transporter FocA (FNT family)